MKKATFLLLFIFTMIQGKAQVDYTFYTGASLNYAGDFKEYLTNLGLPTFRQVGANLGLDIRIKTARWVTHIEANYIAYRGQNNQNPYATTEGFTFGNSVGYLVVNKYKYSLEPLIGIKYLNFFNFRVRTNNNTANSFATQLQTLNSNQFDYRFNFALHLGLQGGFNAFGRKIMLRAGHHFRLSKVKWYNDTFQNVISDTPNLNPLGSYLSIGVSF